MLLEATVMGISRFSRYAFSICVAAAMLSGCGGSQLPIGAPGPMQQNPAIATAHTSANLIASASSDYHLLHTFSGYDGSYSEASLVDVDGTLYGTTDTGGTSSYGTASPYGTVFAITTSGKETVLHTFNGIGGGFPTGSLIDVNGTLYGTTNWGGTHGYGTVFSISTAGKERVLHRFGGRPITMVITQRPI